MHAVDVVGRGLDPYQDDLLARLAACLGFVGGEDHVAHRGARRGRQPLGNDFALGARIEGGMQELVQGGGVHAADGLLAADQALLRHVHRDPHRRLHGAFSGAGLQQPEPAALEGELDVLHVPVVLLEPLVDPHELPVGLGHLLLEGRQIRLVGGAAREVDGLRSADARHHVFTLGVLQVLAVEVLLAGGRIACEGDAGGAVVSHVAEHHGLDVHRGAPVLGDAVDPPVADRALVGPGTEHRPHRAPELLGGVLGEGASGELEHHLEVGGDQLPPVLGAECGIEIHAAGVLQILEARLEARVGHAENDVAVHLDEAPVAVQGEALVGSGGQAPDAAVVQAEVQHRVHHAGHGDPGAGAHGDEQRVVGVAEAGAHDLLDPAQGGLDVGSQLTRELAAGAAEGGALRRRDGEAGRHRDAETVHLGEVRALAAEDLAHVGAAIRPAVSEEVDPARAPPGSLAAGAGLLAAGTGLAAGGGGRPGGRAPAPGGHGRASRR
jgi:hypothetical protein